MYDALEGWLIALFTGRNDHAPIDIEEDYYCSRLIDSFGIIELIGEIEKRFDVLFDDEEFQKSEFRTIRGLRDMIRQKRIDSGLKLTSK